MRYIKLGGKEREKIVFAYHIGSDIDEFAAPSYGLPSNSILKESKLEKKFLRILISIRART